MLTKLTIDVFVVGGGTGGSTAAIQCFRRGVKTIIVSEFVWLGGMLTAAGVQHRMAAKSLPYKRECGENIYKNCDRTF